MRRWRILIATHLVMLAIGFAGGSRSGTSVSLIMKFEKSQASVNSPRTGSIAIV